MKQYTILDLFSGVGGLSYGFTKHPEFQVLLANEIDKDIAKAYQLNHPDVMMLNCDISELTADLLKDKLNGQTIDIVIGGPPCQSYSTIGKRQLDDRANLFLQYKRILKILQPKVFIFENVVGILSMDNGKLFTTIKEEFEQIGYSLKYKVMDSADYGIPQHRERVILVGVKGENNFIYPKKTHGKGLKPYVTLRDAIGDLPSLELGEHSTTYRNNSLDNEFLSFVRDSNQTYLEEHVSPKHSDSLIQIMKTLKEGQSKKDLPLSIRPKKGYANTYAKLWWNKPSTTITRNFACPSSSRCIHPTDSRALSIREGARLQSFPDSYKFYGSNTKKRLEIGNAVPPLLSMSIAREVLVVLDKLERHG